MRAITAMGLCNEPGPGIYSPNQVTRELATVGLRGGVKFLYVLPCFGTLNERREMIPCA